MQSLREDAETRSGGATEISMTEQEAQASAAQLIRCLDQLESGKPCNGGCFTCDMRPAVASAILAAWKRGVGNVDRLVAVLLQVQDAVKREGWEEGPTLTEAMDRVEDELFNHDTSEGSERAKDIVNVRRLRACHYMPWKVTG